MHRLVARQLRFAVDPPTAFAALFAAEPHAFWLDASDGAGWSYLGAAGDARSDWRGGVFDELASALAGLTVDTADAPPGMAFRLGWVGWLGYELWHETAARRPVPAPRDAELLLVDRMLAIDPDGTAWLVALDTTSGSDWLSATERDLAAVRERPRADPVPGPERGPAPTPVWRHSDPEYLGLIRRCREAIGRGDAYQLCLTNTATVPGSFDALEVYSRLRATSPTHHAGFVRIDDTVLLSASPEVFLRVSPDGVLTTRPIKGTRGRGATDALDSALRSELVASGKERAENLMIVDLMRNDLSRVARLGTVRVTGLLEVETYAQVHQLVSTVGAELADGLTGVDAVRALFPAGSMTGAPKVRAIELLDGLESGPRGVYSGAFGYFGLDGAIELAMVIRSIVVTPHEATVGAGGGITALSDPGEELAEMHLKAAPLLSSLVAP